MDNSKRRSSEIYNESLRLLVTKLLHELKEQGFSESTCSNYVSRLRPIQVFMQGRGISVYSPEVGNAYLDEYFTLHHPCKQQKNAIKVAVHRLNDCASEKLYCVNHSFAQTTDIPFQFKKDGDSFLALCKKDGNSERTLSRKKHALAIFLTKCENEGICKLQELTPETVILCCLDVSDKWQWYIIRDFLKFLMINHLTDVDLSSFVPRLSRECKLPSTYTIDEIKKLEASVDRSSLIGKRDYVIVLLASRLGLRASDILALQVSNLDFNQEIISLTTIKTQEFMQFPMISDIKEALLDHLKSSEIKSGYLFRRLLPPFVQLGRSSISQIISDHIKRAEINYSGKTHGPQALRSSLATSMVNDDIPYEVVRKVLGHSSRNAVKHYAKVDIEKLRRCALIPPREMNEFQLFLEGGAPLA